MSDSNVSVNQFMVADLPFEELVRWCRASSVAGIGVLRGVVDELGPATVGRVLREHGVAPTSVCVALGLVDADAEQRERKLGSAHAALASATELGVPLVVVVGGADPGLPLAAARSQAGEQIARLAERAERLGGQLLIEPLHPAMAWLSAYTTLGEALAVADAVPHTGVVLDAWHLWTDPDLDEHIAKRARDVDVVHLADWSAEGGATGDRAVPGGGLIDLRSLVTGLSGAGFTGWWEIEVLAVDRLRDLGPVAFLDQVLAATRDLLRPQAALDQRRGL